jgi:hypothetical protein
MVFVSNIHDHSLLEYRVDLANCRITFITLPEKAASPIVQPRQTVFEGREAHHFDAVSSGAVFLDIEEIPLFEFLRSHQTEFDETSRMFGAPSWWNGSLEAAERYLTGPLVHTLAHEFWCLPGSGDAVTTDDYAKLIEQARAHSSTYNAELVRRIRSGAVK